MAVNSETKGTSLKTKRNSELHSIIVPVIALLAISACTKTISVQKAPRLKIAKAVLARDVDTSGSIGLAVNTADTFSTKDDQIYSHVTLSDLSGRHHLRWEWIAPDGRTYAISANFHVRAPPGKYLPTVTAWNRLPVRGKKAESMPGKWKVQVLLDDEYLASQSFELSSYKEAGIGKGKMPPLLTITDISLSKSALEAGDTAELKVKVLNAGPGDARDVSLELSTDTKGLIFPAKQSFRTIKSDGGGATVQVPIKGDMTLDTGTAELNINVTEPHFRVKIKGKRLKFQTIKARKPELILAKFAAGEGEEVPSKNRMIDLNEIFDVAVAVQNVGQGDAENVELEVVNTQKGVIFLGKGKGKHLVKLEKDKIVRLPSGKYKIVNFRYFVNSDFREDKLRFSIKATEKWRQYGFSETKLVAIDTMLKEEGQIRRFDHMDGDQRSANAKVVIEDIPDLQVDVDVNIPKTDMQNPDAVAVVIGNRNYRNRDVPQVRWAIRDAETVKDYLISTLGYRHGNILFAIDIGKGEFEALFGNRDNPDGKLSFMIKEGKSDVFVYYSGHGAPDLKTQKGYFVPVDCDPSVVSINGYALDLFYANLEKLKARSVTVVMDACFSGGTNAGPMLVDNASPVLLRVKRSGAGQMRRVSALCSSDGDQISSWHNEKQHGLFTYFFLKALSGDADKNQDKKLTLSEIHQFLSDRTEGVPYWARRLHNGRVQTPVLNASDPNKVLVIYP